MRSFSSLREWLDDMQMTSPALLGILKLSVVTVIMLNLLGGAWYVLVLRAATKRGIGKAFKLSARTHEVASYVTVFCRPLRVAAGTSLACTHRRALGGWTHIVKPALARLAPLLPTYHLALATSCQSTT